MKKRTESATVTAILKYCQCLENSGKIKWCDRLNSGAVLIGKRRVRLCRVGTPDIMLILNDGFMVWVEVKHGSGKQRKEQIEFEMMIKPFWNHEYVLVKSLDNLCDYLKTKI